MDFLGLRNLSVIERALDLIERPSGDRPDIDARGPRRRGHLRACCAGATRSGSSSSRVDPMRSAHALARPDQLRRRRRPRRPVPARARWRRTCTTTTPTARTAGKPITLRPPRPRGDPRRHLRAHDLPGVGDAGGPEVRRLLAGGGRQPPQGLREEDPRPDRGRAGEVRGRLRRPRATARRWGPQLFDIIEPFADYAFNKSHSYGYGLVAYQTAWLKAHYPVEYMAALLTSVKDNKDKTAVYLGECRIIGHRGAGPRRNRSGRRVRARPARGRPRTRRDGPASSSGWLPSATSARAWSSASWPSGRPTARSPTSTTSAGGSTPSC